MLQALHAPAGHLEKIHPEGSCCVRHGTLPQLKRNVIGWLKTLTKGNVTEGMIVHIVWIKALVLSTIRSRSVARG
jgi:hypothetical protein